MLPAWRMRSTTRWEGSSTPSTPCAVTATTPGREATLNLLERGLTHIRNVVRYDSRNVQARGRRHSLRPRRYRRSSIAHRTGSLAKAASDCLGQRPSSRISPVAVESVRQVDAQSPDQRVRRDACRRIVHLRAHATDSGSRSKSVTKALGFRTTLPNTSSEHSDEPPGPGGPWTLDRAPSRRGRRRSRYNFCRKPACRP